MSDLLADELHHRVAARRYLAEQAAMVEEWPTAALLTSAVTPPIAAFLAVSTPDDTLRRCAHAEGLMEQHVSSRPGNGDRAWCLGHGSESMPWPCRDWLELAESWGVDTGGVEPDPLS